MILFSVAFLAARCILSLRLLHSALAIHVIKIYAKNLLGKFLEHVTVPPCTPAPLLSHTFHSTKVASREILSRTAQLAGEEDPPRNRIRHRNRNMAALHDMQGRLLRGRRGKGHVSRVHKGGKIIRSFVGSINTILMSAAWRFCWRSLRAPQLESCPPLPSPLSCPVSCCRQSPAACRLIYDLICSSFIAIPSVLSLSLL